MSVTVKFKSDEVCPCTNGPSDEAQEAAWQFVRGKEVRLGRVIPRAQVHRNAHCDTDVYWEVLSDDLIAATDAILDESGPVVVCRHMLEMGD